LLFFMSVHEDASFQTVYYNYTAQNRATLFELDA
jgi:hypothetical protein